IATISVDFLVAGVHAEGRWQSIQSRVRVGDAVQLVRNRARSSDGSMMSVVLADGTCIGLVPDEDARVIVQELDRGGRVQATVKKIANDGQFPVPVVGSRVHCIATDDVELSPSVSTRRVQTSQSRGAKLALTLAVGLAGGVLIVWAFLAR